MRLGAGGIRLRCPHSGTRAGTTRRRLGDRRRPEPVNAGRRSPLGRHKDDEHRRRRSRLPGALGTIRSHRGAAGGRAPDRTRARRTDRCQHDERCCLRHDCAALGRREQLGQRLVEVGSGQRPTLRPAQPGGSRAHPCGRGRGTPERRHHRSARLQSLSDQLDIVRRRRCRQPTDDTYLFVVVYRGPCSEVLTSADGQTSSIVDFTQNTTVFTPGTFRSDPVLGDLWFGDAGGNCDDPMGPPPAWCGR
jgi:hypothetical protein